jgi:hypothetical protein
VHLPLATLLAEGKADVIDAALPADKSAPLLLI